MINEDKLFATIMKGSISLLIFMTVAGWLFFSTKIALGAFAGGVIAITNFFWIRNVLQRILTQLPSKAGMYSQLRFIARLTITAFFLYFIITSDQFSLIGLFAGLSIIVLNIIAISIYNALRAGG